MNQTFPFWFLITLLFDRRRRFQIQWLWESGEKITQIRFVGGVAHEGSNTENLLYCAQHRTMRVVRVVGKSAPLCIRGENEYGNRAISAGGLIEDDKQYTSIFVRSRLQNLGNELAKPIIPLLDLILTA
jgi:hypothetical protein